MATSAAISKELREEYETKLMTVLDEVDELAEKKKQISDTLGGELKLVKSEMTRIRRVLKGQESPQTEIPGTEVGERKRAPIVAAILSAADGIKVVKKLRKRIQKAAEEGDKKRAALEWRRGQGNGVEQADAPGGKYLLTANMGRWDLCWKPTDSKIQRFLGNSLHRDEAEKMAEQDLLERQGDAILKNAGEGALTAKSLKGPATKWKGKRRG